MPDPSPHAPDDHAPLARPKHAAPPARARDWTPSRRGLLLIAAALLVGVVLFAIVWRNDRSDFYTVEPVIGPRGDDGYDPLPAPLPKGEPRGASGMADAEEREREAARIEEEQARIEPPPELEPPPGDVPSEVPGVPLAAGSSPEPIPGQSPPPNYPRRALRRGVEGTVLVRAEVGPDGVPVSVSLVQGSRSRDLDRAALDAVRGWRFRPAQVDGRPTVGSVVIPIEFRARR
jgi:protein TonB